MAKSMGAPLRRILLVGCEPATLGPEEGQMGLSEVVENAVERAVTLTESLVSSVLNDEWPLNTDEREERKFQKG
jgi:hydrogenase maturation protease